jgi:hypothetical protein
MPSPVIASFNLGAPELLLILIILGSLSLLATVPAILACVVLSRVPRESRKQEPGLAFLLLIPIFSLVWTFFVHPRVAASLKTHFESKGDHSKGDCGAALALWLCITSACRVIPLLGILSAMASLVLLIVFYVKAFELSAEIQRASSQSPVPAPPAATSGAGPAARQP